MHIASATRSCHLSGTGRARFRVLMYSCRFRCKPHFIQIIIVSRNQASFILKLPMLCSSFPALGAEAAEARMNQQLFKDIITQALTDLHGVIGGAVDFHCIQLHGCSAIIRVDKRLVVGSPGAHTFKTLVCINPTPVQLPYRVQGTPTRFGRLRHLPPSTAHTTCD